MNLVIANNLKTAKKFLKRFSDKKTKLLILNTKNVENYYQNFEIIKISKLITKEEVFVKAKDSVHNLKETLSNPYLQDIITYFENDIFFSLFMPLESIKEQIDKIVRDHNIKTVYFIGGNPNVSPYIVFNGLGEGSREFFLKKCWIINPFIYNELRKNNVNVKWLKKESKIKILTSLKIRGFLFKSFRILTIARYKWKNKNIQKYSTTEGRYDIFIVRGDTAARYVENFKLAKNNQSLVILDFSRLNQKEILSNFKNNLVFNIPPFSEFIFEYLKKRKKFKVNVRDLFKNSNTYNNKNINAIYFILKDLFTILPDLVFRELMFKKYRNDLKMLGIKPANIYTTETFVYGSVIHKKFAQLMESELFFLQTVALPSIKYPLLPYNGMILTSESSYEYFKDIIETEFFDYRPFQKEKLIKNNKISKNIAVFTQPDEYREVFKDIFTAIYEVFSKEKALVNLKLLVKLHQRDNLKNYKSQIKKIEKLIPIEIRDSLEKTLDESDIAIVSTSSVIYDLLKLNKKVIIFVPPELMNDNVVIKDVRKSINSNFSIVNDLSEFKVRMKTIIQGN